MKFISSLIHGAVRLLTESWINNQYSIRVSGTVAAISGSEVIVRKEPNGDLVQMGVIEGRGLIGNRESREIRYLTANQWAQDTPGGLGPVQHLSREQWETVITQDGLEIKATPPCDMAPGNWRWGNGNIFALTDDGRWYITNGNGRGAWSCSLNSYGDPELLIQPDTRDWWTRAVIAPDGQSLSGVTEVGDDVDAVRVYD